MDFAFALPLLIIRVLLPLMAGLMAKTFWRKFWPWFVIGITLPLVANIILLCLPEGSKKKINKLRAVENEEIFDHLFINGNSKRDFDHEIHFSARA